jgi:putative addiction module component (TIGR02574 family)
MSKDGNQLLTESLKLPPTERAELVENILSSFEFPSRNKIDELWAQEAESRIDALERGELSTISAAEVFIKIENPKKK